MDLQITERDGIAFATLSGFMSSGESEKLTDALADHAFQDGARVVIDLSGLKTIDSSGLSALIHVVTRSRTTRGRVILVKPSDFVRNVFSTTRLDHYFDLADSTDAAVRQLSSM